MRNREEGKRCDFLQHEGVKKKVSENVQIRCLSAFSFQKHDVSCQNKKKIRKNRLGKYRISVLRKAIRRDGENPISPQICFADS